MSADCQFYQKPGSLFTFTWRLNLPFEAIVVTTIIKFISSAVAKICTLRTARLRELYAPWLSR